MRRVGARPLAFVFVWGAMSGCAEEGSTTSGQPLPEDLFSDQFDRIAVEVDYMPGAEPYTGEIAAGRPDTWSLFGENVQRLFPPDEKTVEFPTTLEGMEAIDAGGQASYSVDDILALADAHRDTLSADGTASFYFVWVDGFFRDSSGVQQTVLGVSIGRTGVVAMFKPVIANASALPAVARFGEQTTLIHEFGHAIGLVNNGIPLSVDHHDAENGAHCTNRDCVMFWALESISDVLTFARNLDQTGSSVVFGPDCLSDVDTLSAG